MGDFTLKKPNIIAYTYYMVQLKFHLFKQKSIEDSVRQRLDTQWNRRLCWVALWMNYLVNWK